MTGNRWIPWLVAPAVLLLPGTPALHITPTVELVKQTAVIRQTLPEATQFFVREVQIGRDDLHTIKQIGDFEPDDPTVRFFGGKDEKGRPVGVVLFAQVNTSQHGPIEVGVTIRGDGKVARTVVTKATVETKPWVLEVIRSGFLQEFEGVPSASPVDLSAKIPRGRLSAMPTYMGQVINQAVNEGIVLYHVLYKSN